MSGKSSFAAGQLRALVQRIENLEAEKKTIADDIGEVYAEAKANGFDTKIIRRIIKLRKQSQTEREQEQSMVDVYLEALGDLPLFRERTSTASEGARA